MKIRKKARQRKSYENSEKIPRSIDWEITILLHFAQGFSADLVSAENREV